MSKRKPKAPVPYSPPKKRAYVHIKEVEADATMDLWKQFLRFEVEARTPVIVNVIADRVHRFKPRQSRPAAFLHFSDAGQLISIAVAALSAASVLALAERKFRTSEDQVAEIIRCLDSAWDLARAAPQA